MAIHIFCPSCKSSYSLKTARCENCNLSFGRSKKYRVSVSVGGKRASKVVENLTLAKEVEAALKADLIRDRFEILKQHKTATLSYVWKLYLPWAKEHKKSWKTDFYYYQKHIEPRFGQKLLDKISPLDIERLKHELNKGINKRGQPYSKATIKHQLVLLKRLFNLAIKWGIYSGSNPVEAVDLPKLDNQKTEFLTQEELSRLLDTLGKWPFRESAAFVMFALFTGLRRGELFRLTWNDVNLQKGTVTLREPKGGKTTTVPLSTQALKALSALDHNSDYVFPGKNGKQRTNFKGPWERIKKAAGLPEDFRLHGLRHHFASTLASNGVDLYTIGKLLSHKQTSTTQRYAHLADEHMRRAAQLSGNLLSNKG